MRKRTKRLFGDFRVQLKFEGFRSRNGSNARGYFQWAFLDVLELLDGYESSYGLYYVDFDDLDLKRQPKLSAHWYSHFLKSKVSAHMVLSKLRRI
ncbi:beta-glucosidase 11 [Quercus suber]|uniref:Beta-glucosidase 11 n=1 Tax=Quercus suber TaxID=58331 RepID=A0AAW0K933_QUESU